MHPQNVGPQLFVTERVVAEDVLPGSFVVIWRACQLCRSHLGTETTHGERECEHQHHGREGDQSHSRLLLNAGLRLNVNPPNTQVTSCVSCKLAALEKRTYCGDQTAGALGRLRLFSPPAAVIHVTGTASTDRARQPLAYSNAQTTATRHSPRADRQPAPVRPLTVDDIASKLELSGSGIRAQITAMERDGVVRRVGRRAGTTRPSQGL